ncbi:MAG: cell division protein ZapB [Treponema sp.]|nr:cell division protein ZapB [Treponema sp.]
MISLDQILLLEQKVESAVKKITQLQMENDALRSKCSELTNALSSKTELLSSFEQDQSKIEDGILKALDRLNSIENSVLKADAESTSKIVINEQPKPAAEVPHVQNSASQVQNISSTPSDGSEDKKSENGGQFDIF